MIMVTLTIITRHSIIIIIKLHLSYNILHLSHDYLKLIKLLFEINFEKNFFYIILNFKWF